MNGLERNSYFFLLWSDNERLEEKITSVFTLALDLRMKTREEQIWSLHISTNQIYKETGRCYHQRPKMRDLREEIERRRRKWQLWFCTSPMTRSRKKRRRDLDKNLDRFIRDLWRLGSSVQRTTTTDEREVSQEKTREKRKEEILTAKVFRFLWNSVGLHSGF